MQNTLLFTVHTVTEHLVTVPGTVDGVNQDVQVNAMVVELVSSDGTMCWTAKFRGDLTDARKLYVQGAQIAVTLESKGSA